jgi:hypothetical protein
MIGRYATIRGYIAGTKYASYSNGSPTFLNMGVDYPSSRRVRHPFEGSGVTRIGPRF